MYTPVQVAPVGEDGSEAALAAEIVTIGDELSRGEIVDTNAAWLGERLTALGFDVRFRQGVNDRPRDMQAVLTQAASRSRVVVVSGGLGPTSDDVTVDVAALLCGVAAAEEPSHAARMRSRYAERGFALTPNNLRQVRVPAGAVVLHNAAGAAPGFMVHLQQADLFFMPGVPREMKPMFQTEVVPRLMPLVASAGSVAIRRTYRVIGLGESHVDHRLRGLLDQPSGAGESGELPYSIDGASHRSALSGFTTLHYRLAFPEVLVTLVVRRPSAESAQAVLDRLDAEVRHRLGGTIYSAGSDGADDLAVVVGRKLREREQTVATAESCTGGMIGQMLTAVPGSSAYYVGGVISYANAVKQQVLGVPEAVLREHGAVSQACVELMAQGARRVTGATYGVAVSGVAGPDGGTPDKPVGTVHLAVAGPDGVQARLVNWPGDREQVRRVAACAALNLLDKILSPERRQQQGPPGAPGLQERLG